MTLYCYAPAGSVEDGPRRLPSTWKDRTDFDQTPDIELAALGWLPSNAVDGVGFSAPVVYADRVEYVLEMSGLRAQKEAEIRLAYQAAATGPVLSDALGEPYEYSAAIEARIDMVWAGREGAPVVYSCRRVSDGVKASVEHSAAQMAQVLAEAADWRGGLVVTLNQKLDAIEAAGTPDALALITW